MYQSAQNKGIADYYTKSNKPVNERKIPHDLTSSQEESNEQNNLMSKREPEA